MTKRRLETFQWFGLLAGPLAFLVEHVVGVFTTFADCNPAGSRWDVPQHAMQLGTMSLAALVIVLAEGAAFLAYRETKALDYEADPPGGRIRFLATAALAVGPLFLMLVLLGGLGAAFHPDCRQS
jgi:hypothetical protein